MIIFQFQLEIPSSVSYHSKLSDSPHLHV